MGVLDDLEAALADMHAVKADPQLKPESVMKLADAAMTIEEHGEVVLAVCRAAVAYREAMTRPNGGHTLDEYNALLAATEGLT